MNGNEVLSQSSLAYWILVQREIEDMAQDKVEDMLWQGWHSLDSCSLFAISRRLSAIDSWALTPRHTTISVTAQVARPINIGNSQPNVVPEYTPECTVI